jgi:hypothetical protein
LPDSVAFKEVNSGSSLGSTIPLRRDTGPRFDDEQTMRAPPIKMLGACDEEDFEACSGGKGRRISLGHLKYAISL